MQRSSLLEAPPGITAARAQVASLTITETYLADFRLVWRCVVAHLRNVFDNTWMLAQISPAVVVDAVRAARLLDSVVNVRPRCSRMLSRDH